MRRLTSFLSLCTLMPALMLSAPGTAVASHDGTRNGGDSASLVAAVAEANQRMADLGGDIQIKQEGVNGALVEIAAARDTLAQARRDVAASEQALTDSQHAIDAAQQRFDRFAASTYMNGPSGALPLAQSPEQILTGASTQQTLTISFQRVKSDLLRRQTDRTNKLSEATAARARAESAAADAQRRQDAAVVALRDAQQTFAAQQREVERLAAERDSARARLDASRPATATAAAPSATKPGAAPPSGAPWDRGTPSLAGGAQASLWDTTLPMVPSANVAGDPVAIINAVLKIMATSAQLTADMGRNFLTKLGILSPVAAAADPGITNGRIPRLYGRQASEFVIRRAMSQLGVPYSWGGGNANGPSRGIDQGANTVGFDCSGLMLYAFAGVGIKLDHYSGSQYNAGRKIPSSQMRRGDLIFYGPNASQHEAMYLGDGMMIEAPYTGSVVKISPVRTSGMTPYVTRLIEY